jgi:uncharacterized membrane protein YgcG
MVRAARRAVATAVLACTGCTVTPGAISLAVPQVEVPKVTVPTINYTVPTVTYTAPAVVAQGPAVQAGAAEDTAAAPAQADQQLCQLVAPIALYPDPLLAQLLPAATYPQLVEDAQRFLQSNPQADDAAIDAQDWAQNPNVRALAHYPAALKVLADEIQWTTSLGGAFDSNAAGVTAAIQEMRSQAQAAGNLKTCEQTTVVVDQGVISIQPVTIAAPLFVPVYDPVVVYSSPVAITWGAPYAVVPGYGIDWYGGAVFAGPWYGGWYHDGYWGHDPYWHYDHYHYFYHDHRWGPAPRFNRAHFAAARAMHGREAEFHRALARHESQVAGKRSLRNNAMANATGGKRGSTGMTSTHQGQNGSHPTGKMTAPKGQPSQPNHNQFAHNTHTPQQQKTGKAEPDLARASSTHQPQSHAPSGGSGSGGSSSHSGAAPAQHSSSGHSSSGSSSSSHKK